MKPNLDLGEMRRGIAALTGAIERIARFTPAAHARTMTKPVRAGVTTTPRPGRPCDPVRGSASVPALSRLRALRESPAAGPERLDERLAFCRTLGAMLRDAPDSDEAIERLANTRPQRPRSQRARGVWMADRSDQTYLDLLIDVTTGTVRTLQSEIALYDGRLGGCQQRSLHATSALLNRLSAALRDERAQLN